MEVHDVGGRGGGEEETRGGPAEELNRHRHVARPQLEREPAVGGGEALGGAGRHRGREDRGEAGRAGDVDPARGLGGHHHHIGRGPDGHRGGERSRGRLGDERGADLRRGRPPVRGTGGARRAVGGHQVDLGQPGRAPVVDGQARRAEGEEENGGPDRHPQGQGGGTRCAAGRA